MQRGFSAMVVLIGLAVVAILFGVTWFFTQTNARPQEKAMPQATRVVQRTTDGPRPTKSSQTTKLPNNKLDDNWQTFVSEAIIIKHPVDWVATKKPMQEGYSVTILPKTSDKLLLYPKVILEVTNKDTLSIEKRINNFVQAGFQRVQGKVGVYQAAKFTHQFILPSTSGNKVPPIALLYYLFEDGNYIYVVGYEYEQEATSPAEIETLTKMLQTVSIKNPQKLLY